MNASTRDPQKTGNLRHQIGSGLVTLVFCAAHASSLVPQQKSGEAELLALHQNDRRAHFAHDVEALLASHSPEFISVRDGNIRRRSQDELRKRFTEYFRGAEFTAWDDLEPPIVHVSPDGQMGWMIVRVKISISRSDATGKRTSENVVMAWMSAYEKHEGQWQHIASVTTVEP
jgi:Domain of unknown function (DUF4440)